MSAIQDIVVVSDLHLGRGKNQKTARYYRLEAFFYDDDFLHFCDHLVDDASRRNISFKLILNGDTFDLLRVDHDRGSDQSLRERLYGPSLTPQVAVEIISQILIGHPVFVQALAQVLAAGHAVVFLPGNHDIEMQWPQVQDAVRQAIGKALHDRVIPEIMVPLVATKGELDLVKERIVAVARAIDLSRDKYCSVWNSIRPDVALTTSFVVSSVIPLA